jgi:predicted lipoprotein with Yx(FWY)xxD motif
VKSKRLAANAIAALALIAASCGGSSPSTSASSPSPSPAATPSAAGTGATIATASNSKIGQQILVDSKGISLYLFVADTGTASTCYNGCAQIWPPVLTTGAPVAGSGAQTSLLGTTTRTDGKVEVTYAGHPLYYFVQDKQPGDVTGQAVNSFGALWWVVGPSGAAIH